MGFEWASIVGENSNSHTNISREDTGRASQEEWDCGPEVAELLFNCEKDHKCHEDDEDSNVHVLHEEESVGSSFNVGGDL